MKLKLNSIKYGKEGMKIEYDKVFNYFKDKITEVEEGYFIEINTLEELLALMDEVRVEIVIGRSNKITNIDGYIEIYDGFRE